MHSKYFQTHNDFHIWFLQNIFPILGSFLIRKHASWAACGGKAQYRSEQLVWRKKTNSETIKKRTLRVRYNQIDLEQKQNSGVKLQLKFTVIRIQYTPVTTKKKIKLN